ncbi:MAG TPA: hypothetical protein DCL35_06330 [Candidatus Omnitrophica bacterium]|nr:hypothetical protein [Candidatus Omnitrophota bacterium]
MAKDPICGMEVDERAGLRSSKEGKTYFFCSDSCLQRFSKAPFYKNKSFLVASVLALAFALSVPFVPLRPFTASFLSYLATVWWAVSLGLFLGGLIDHFVPREYVSHILASPKKRTIFYSVIIGFLMSACSHGILALSMELHKKGASNPAVVAFLLASPWANIGITVLLFGFFGFKAFYIVIAAIVTALVTGLIFQFLDAKGLIEKNTNAVLTGEGFSISNDLRRRWSEYTFSKAVLVEDVKGVWQGMVTLGDMVLWWILIGMAIASFAGAYVPEHIFHQYLGPSLFGLFVTLALATVIEVCSEGSAPMAFEIFRQTGALGNSFVFLMAGVVTDYTEIGLLWHNVGRKTAIWMPVVAVPQVVLWGILANSI